MNFFIKQYVKNIFANKFTLFISYVHNSVYAFHGGNFVIDVMKKSTAIKMAFVLSKSCYVNALIKTRCNDEPFSNNNQRPR